MKLGDVSALNPRRDQSISDATIISFIEMKSLLESGSVCPVIQSAKEYLKGYSTFRNRDVLVAKITPCFQNNKIGLARIDTSYGFGTTEFHVLRAQEELLAPEYLVLFLRQQKVLAAGEAQMTGSGGQRRVPKSFFENLKIPLSPLNEQKRIAEILGGVAESIQKVQKQLTQAERLKELKYRSLTKSSHSLKSLSELGVNKVAGKSIVAKPDDEHELNRVIKVSSVSSGAFVASESKPLPSDYQPNHLHRINKGDLLFARASGSANLLGACCIVNEDVEFLYLPDKVWRLEVDETTIPKSYLLQALRSREFRAIAESQFSSSTGVKNIKSSVLMDFKIPVLEKENFQQFSATVANVNILAQKLHQKLTLLQELQRSLSARAFAGQL